MSEWIVPLLLVGVVLWAAARHVDVYTAVTDGAKNGLQILLRIFPCLLALLTGVGMLRASGAFDLLESWLAPLFEKLGMSAQTLPLILIRPFSGSGALGVGAELIQTYGPDSTVGRTAAVMLGSTETTFYTVAVYFGAAGVARSRYAIPAALAADVTGFLVAGWSVRLLFGG